MQIGEVFKKLRLIFRFEDLTVSDLARAAEMKWRDFEDALQYDTAARIHADYIITRNLKDFGQSQIPALSPGEFLTIIQ